MCARGRGETAMTANHSSGVVTFYFSFSLMAVTFLLEWFVMMIEVPQRPTYVSIGTEERTLRENWNIEASRTIAGALTRRPLRCHVRGCGHPSQKISQKSMKMSNYSQVAAARDPLQLLWRPRAAAEAGAAASGAAGMPVRWRRRPAAASAAVVAGAEPRTQLRRLPRAR